MCRFSKMWFSKMQEMTDKKSLPCKHDTKSYRKDTSIYKSRFKDFNKQDTDINTTIETAENKMQSQHDVDSALKKTQHALLEHERIMTIKDGRSTFNGTS